MKQKRRIDEFDSAFSDGIFVEPNHSPSNLRVRDMHEWFVKNNWEPGSLTDEELEEFRAN